MHEVFFERVITDYLTGASIQDSTYEDLRQGLARMLVEEKGYPRHLLRPKYAVRAQVDGREEAFSVDIAAFAEDGTPLLALFFCPGEVGTFVRESVAAARVHQPQPFPVVLVTDSMRILLVAAQDGSTLGEGWYAVPRWEELPGLAAAHPCPPLPPERLEKESRILAAYTALGGACCGGACELTETSS
ncbi:MAG: hypothetical protein JG774_2100 [Desulfomicrobiaceae bacterium]|jgi:hypothetical protein|nr:hypothetical protein [Desulfomicrobiaceae bacterium]MDI3493723.1 hypothetical protein [Desulfomicrobiaceae bacterium]MDK2874020.1 hypothetical protein [Desulfomicrobiaceae bacterium]